MKLAPLLLGFALASCAAPRHEPSIFGEPIFVDGKRVGDDAIELALIYGPGGTRLESLTMALIVDEEIAREVRALAALEQDPAGAEARVAAELHAKCDITEAAFEAEYQRACDEFHVEYPTLDLDAEIRRSFGSIEAYRDYLRTQLGFDRVFLPDDPAEWPQVTIEALRSDPSGGEVLLEDARFSHEARCKRAQESRGELEREDPLYMSFLRQIVRDALLRSITVKRHSDGIDPRLAFWVDTNGDGKPELELTVDELWKQVRERVTPEDVEAAKRWCVLARATRTRLEKDGGAPSSAARRAWMAELDHMIRDDGGGIEGLATGVYRFPSVEHFLEYYELHKGFESLIAPRLADASGGALSPTLTEYLPRAEQTLGTGRVDAELLLVAALDLQRFTLKPGGWAEARRTARMLREQYERDPSPERWARLLDEHSEFWDPPQPEPVHGHQRIVCRDMLKKGRFGEIMRGTLMFQLQETPCSEWIHGGSVADEIFFGQEAGTVAGPFRGPFGWYLTRLNERIPPTQPLRLDDPAVRERLREDYVRAAFVQYSKEALSQADIRGWKPL